MAGLDKADEMPPSFEDAVASSSTAPPAPPKDTKATLFQTRFAFITINERDKVRFIGFSDEDVAAIRPVFIKAWPKGIQAERKYGRAQEFKLGGYPWGSEGFTPLDDTQRLVRRLLEALYNHGWILQAGLDVSKKVADKG
jgi:hypothetical protein